MSVSAAHSNEARWVYKSVMLHYFGGISVCLFESETRGLISASGLCVIYETWW